MAQESDAHETRAALDERRQRLLAQLKQAADEERAAQATISATVEEIRLLRLGTWADIGEAIGISGQAAFQRYGKRKTG